MADQKISQLPDSGAPQDTDQIPIARAGTTLSLLISNLKAAIPGGVSSVFTRTGAVTAQSGDYTAAQVGALPSTDSISDIAAANATGADWSNNSKKITSLANGVGAQDAAAFGQIPAALPPSGSAGGDLTGTYPNPTIGSAKVTVAKLAAAVTLDAIATANATAAAIAMNAKKITGLANGSASDDAAAFGQIPTALPPNGSASGDLGGSYPSPTVTAIHETSGPTKLTAGTITDGQFLKRVGSTLVSAAGNAGTVTSVTATDTSIVVAGTGAAPTIATGTLDVIAADHPPAANWSNNSKKITSVADPASAQDAATKAYVDAAVPGNAGGKGHLTTATAANAPADLAPGANGTVLAADSTQSVGLAWTTNGTALTLLASSVLGSAGTFDFSSIPGGYNQLIIQMILRGTSGAGTFERPGIRFNNDSTVNHYGWAFSGSSSASNAMTDTAIQLPDAAGNGAVTGAFGAYNLAIPQYASTANQKMVTGTSFSNRNATGIFGNSGGGVWTGVAAITRIQVITVTNAGTNWATGSAVFIYGAS